MLWKTVGRGVVCLSLVTGCATQREESTQLTPAVATIDTAQIERSADRAEAAAAKLEASVTSLEQRAQALEDLVDQIEKRAQVRQRKNTKPQS
jgi:Skp family chaperone for outer membrane proteins